MKYFKIIIFVLLSIYSAKKGFDRIAVRNGEAGMLFNFAAVAFGITAIIFAIQLYQEKKQENNKKEY